ncbi:MAG: MFS transporter [Lachnospiraceae bacterium]
MLLEIKNWKKNFMTIWCGQAVSQFSSSILQFAIVWYLTDKTKSAMVLSAAMFMGFLPQALLGPVVGVFIDRYPRKIIMIVSDLFIAGVSLLLVLFNQGGTIPIWLILIVLGLRSIGTAFHHPSLQAATPQLVPMEQLTKCAGYSQSLESISMILSPAIAAVLYTAWSLQSIILLDVAGAIVAVAALCISVVPSHLSGEPPIRRKVLQEAKEGFTILRSNKGMMELVMIGALYTIALMPISALFPLMCMSYFKGTSVEASIAEIVFSVGFLIGSFILAKWGGTRNKIYTIVGSYLLMSAALLVSGFLSPNAFPLFAVMAGIMGISGPFYWGMYTPLLQQQFQKEHLGRVISLSGSIRLLAGPIGLGLSGLVSERFGVEKWFLVSGVLTILAAILCLTLSNIRTMDKKN